MIARLFPAARIIACVRHVPWILDSIERLVQANALEPSRMFNFDSTQTIYVRYEVLGANVGMVVLPWNALREAFYGPHSYRLMLLRYETLSTEPERALRAVYEFIGEPYFAHDFAHVELDTGDYDT